MLLEHGVPEVIYSDQGTKFKNQLMKNISTYFGISQKFKLTNSPYSNYVERLHQMLRKLIRMLRSKQLKDQREWNKLLVMAAHAVNNSMCTATGVTPNYLFHGRHESSPGYAVS